MKLNEWDQSAWFNEWLELARKDDSSLALLQSHQNLLNEAAEKARQRMKAFILPYSAGNFSPRGNTAMRQRANGA